MGGFRASESSVRAQEPVSPEQTDVEDAVALSLKSRGSELRREWGAMSLYHCQDLL